jgi:hypothetical protein
VRERRRVAIKITKINHALLINLKIEGKEVGKNCNAMQIFPEI